MSPSTQRQLATPEEVAGFLQMTTGQLAQMRYLGKGPRFVKPTGRQVRYRWDDVDEWLRSRTFAQTGQGSATA